MSAASATSDGFRQRPRHPPRARSEELDGPVVRLGLHVLRQRDRHGAGLDRIGQDAHRRDEGGRQLLGAADAVEEARERAEGVVDRHVSGIRRLELLEHRRADAAREGAGGQQQHGQAVDRRQCGTGQHVRRARPHRGGADPRLQAVLLSGVGDRGVHHGLLVAGEDVGQVLTVGLGGLVAAVLELVLQERLADAGDVAVTEDAEAAGEELLPLAVALAPLVGEETHHGLRHGEPDGRGRLGGVGVARHRAPPRGSRGSTCWSVQVSRTQPWAGSSQMSQARPLTPEPGPAMTLR